MGLKQIIANVKQNFPAILLTLLAIAGAVAAVKLLPNRTAAVLLGILGAVAVSTLVMRELQRATQLAVFWFSAGVVADAAYAKLNDQAPVTIASLVVRLGESLVKLVDVVVRSLGFGGADLKAKMAAVAPEFAWALILVTTLLLAVRLGRNPRNASAKPELRRAA